MTTSTTTARPGLLARLGLVTEMQRYPSDGWFAGVCAGIADYFGWKPNWVRLAFVALFFITAGMVMPLVYIALWFVMEIGDLADPHRPHYGRSLALMNSAAAGAANAAPPSPHAAPALEERFGVLDARLRRMEEAALSKDAALLRELQQLELSDAPPSSSPPRLAKD